MYKIYYEDGDIHDGPMSRTQGHIREVAEDQSERIVEPSRGKVINPPPLKAVVAIVQMDMDGEAEILSGKEYYLWKDQHWVGTDLWHVMAHLEENFDIIKYQKRKTRVKENGKWRDVDMVGLLARMEDTGLVLHGTMETPKRTTEIMTRVVDDVAAGLLPATMKISKGMRLSMQARSK
jgi:hypothetical protein